MDFVIVLAILCVVVLIVSSPLWRQRPGSGSPEEHAAFTGSIELAELEAAREAKYREIRDAELDHRMGKLSDADFEAIDHNLRAEAIEIMHALDRAKAGSSSYHRG